MELIEATADDLDALVDRWHSLAQSMEAYDELNRLVRTDVRDIAKDGFQKYLDAEKTTAYLIVRENETIGYVILREGHHPSRQYSDFLRIVDLFIDDDQRSRGHGTSVVERVTEMARDRGCDHLKVSCEWQNEDARRFYRETDFRPKQIEYVQSLS
ncbi:GCN5-like N-acetyltransferase [Natrinema pellirubrum DSM 15624]|uniref:Acetyltransferase (GNAT) family protein n=1 Tax=Natrinema pellirubrum (strain DSM 15624 / CIP 106293 / JCM 10476 / NCIMB 786 / 157) TaxID=797303 RepID=L0JPV5_NATP1|nr:GNAT family N-acetyltransferase [Natrinema pellirubrum]AGB32647.1 acetyltransferase (GNAT) family protein [Natrinema pellirubrum DSM 15624]ELY73782.1 GCN5-like N-acetyltransferase [Natrinema pellirubrum DSM 15624]